MFKQPDQGSISSIPPISSPEPKAKVVEIYPIPERFQTPPAVSDKYAILAAKKRLSHIFRKSLQDLLERKKDEVLGNMNGENARRSAKEILKALFYLGQISTFSRMPISEARDCHARNLLCVNGDFRFLVSREEIVGSFVFQKSRKQQAERFLFISFHFIEKGLILKLPLSENTIEELSELVVKIGKRIDKAPEEVKPALKILKGSLDWLKMHAYKRAREHSDYLAEAKDLGEDIKEAEATRQLNNPNRANKQVRDVLDHPFQKKRKKHQRRAARTP